jgi:hypothetical protein
MELRDSGSVSGCFHLFRLLVRYLASRTHESLRLPPIETFGRIVGGLNYLFIRILFPMGTLCFKIIGFGLPTTYRGT